MPKKSSKKYKRSIDCNNPKGFSQKAHCAGRKKKESKMSSKLEELVGKSITEEQFDEAAGKKDKCYYKVKARYDVWPSAYASGALVKCRKVGAANWGKSKKEGIEEKMRPAIKKALAQKGYGPIFNAIDTSKQQLKQLRYSRGEIQDTLIDMFGDEDPKILKKIKEGKVLNKEGLDDLKALPKDLKKSIKKNREESVNERDNVGMAYKRTLAKVELKKIKDAILMFQKRIKKQGRVTNARDEEHLKNLIKVYKQMGGKGVKESREASIIQHHQRQLDALVQQYPDSYSRPYPIQTKIETLRNIIAVTKKKMGESINEDVYAIVDKFNQKKQDYDQVYFKDNNLNKVKKHMKKMGKKYGKMNLIKVKPNGKMSLVEAVSKSQAQEIMRQLGGRKFEMLMGVKSKGVGKDGLILHIGRNPKKVSHIVIDLDRGKDLYNLTFGKIFKYQFKVVKKLKGVGVEQLHDTIEKYTGLLTTFRKR